MRGFLNSSAIKMAGQTPCVGAWIRNGAIDPGHRIDIGEPLTAADTRSVINGLTDHGVHVSAKPARVDGGGARRGLCDRRPGCEAARLEWSQFGDRCAITRNDHRLTRLDLPKNGRGFVTEFTLGDRFRL